jgi:hypothetical protein
VESDLYLIQQAFMANITEMNLYSIPSDLPAKKKTHPSPSLYIHRKTLQLWQWCLVHIYYNLSQQLHR